MSEGSASSDESTQWDAIVAHLAQRFPHLVRENEDSVRVVAIVAGQRVGMRIRSTYAYDARIVVMTGELGLLDAMDPFESLAMNRQLVSGALAIDGGVLVLRTVIADLASIDARVDLFAREAATVKKQLTVPRASSTALTHFAD